jgi:RNA polymerase sigma-70 factor (ECF subfamily)
MPDENCNGFEAVYDRHFGQVFGYVAYRLSPDLDAAKDVTQEVFVAAMDRWDSYRGEGTPLAWLRGIARRKISDHLQGRLERARTLDPATLSQLATSSQTSVEDRAMVLAHVMRALPKKQAELLEEKYLEGLSVRQIAQARGMTEKAVECALSRARDALRQRFGAPQRGDAR